MKDFILVQEPLIEDQEQLSTLIQISRRYQKINMVASKIETIQQLNVQKVEKVIDKTKISNELLEKSKRELFKKKISIESENKKLMYLFSIVILALVILSVVILG